LNSPYLQSRQYQKRYSEPLSSFWQRLVGEIEAVTQPVRGFSAFIERPQPEF
jgi:hypothetical protein